MCVCVWGGGEFPKRKQCTDVVDARLPPAAASVVEIAVIIVESVVAIMNNEARTVVTLV